MTLAELQLRMDTYNTNELVHDHMSRVSGLGDWRNARAETIIKNLRYDKVYYVPGGYDINPIIYGQPWHPTTKVGNAVVTVLEAEVVRHLVAVGHPVLAICRGHQLVHAATGGDLVQDMTLLDVDNPYDHYMKTATPLADGVFADVLRSVDPALDHMTLNHTHHQAVVRVGKGFKAVATETGVVEAAEHDTAPVLTMQFHPEYDSHPWVQWYIPTVLAYLQTHLPEEV